ncbi:GNAT family N-acetyltransferase [Anderseniella sp. Alg231-50]|uniref:GNAT family N-acetyltransferase n=1 Tax=Anderseniella sp. Alg231-50 TaxID=1922226 RepID=UPI000D552172
MHIDIRPFTPSDLDELQHIRELAFAPVFSSFRNLVGPKIAGVALASAEAEQAELLAGMCAPDSPEQVFVAVLDGKIVGFTGLSLDENTRVGEIGLNAVHPDVSGRGIGTRLYRFAIEAMKAGGMKVASVGTGGDPSHAPARRAYEKAGFGPAMPSVWMYRSL